MNEPILNGLHCAKGRNTQLKKKNSDIRSMKADVKNQISYTAQMVHQQYVSMILPTRKKRTS